MEIEVKYPKRTEGRNYLKDWDILVNYNNKFPTKADIDRDYTTLPIPKKFWKGWQLNRAPNNEATLDQIFELFNNYQRNPLSNKEMQAWLKANKVRHTSMSVGDVIVLDNNIYVCNTEGWKEVN